MPQTRDITAFLQSAPRARALAHRAAFYPVLFTQGPWVRYNTLKLPDPTGAHEGVIGQGPNLRLLITGDSSALGVGVSSQSQALSGQLLKRLAPHARVDWQLVAKGGNTTPQALDLLRARAPRFADAAVVGLGVNDVTSGMSLATWLDHKHRMIDHLTQRLGVQKIYYSGLPPLHQFPRLPSPLRWTLGAQAQRFDVALQQLLTDRPDVHRITLDLDLHPGNMSADGFHPGAQIYAAWADAVARLLRRDFVL